VIIPEPKAQGMKLQAQSRSSYAASRPWRKKREHDEKESPLRALGGQVLPGCDKKLLFKPQPEKGFFTLSLVQQLLMMAIEKSGNDPVQRCIPLVQ